MNKKGFTLVELLAVIVILAIILVIAIPQIIETINSSRLSAIRDSALLIATQAEKDYLAQKTLDHNYSKEIISCQDVIKISNDYDTCTIMYNNVGEATVKLTGAENGKFSGITCNGTKENMECVKGKLSVFKEEIMNLVKNYDSTSNDIIRLDSLSSSCTNSFRYDNTTENNLRYVGSNPCNYVYFNCDNYDKQTQSSCELWRIVSVGDSIKIVKNESIGSSSWDSSRSDEPDVSSGKTDVSGFNDWRYADLMKTLNDNYSSNETKNNKGEVKIANNSLYWDRKNGLCSMGNSNDLQSCNYQTKGLKDSTKKFIDTKVWHTGGTEYIASNGYGYGNVDNIFAKERGNKTWTGRESTWTGKVALLYPSDYVYATDDNTCLNSLPHNWNETNNSNCLNNYLNKGVDYWTIQPLFKNHHYVLYINSNGQLKDINASKIFNIYPSVYLVDGVLLKSGNGSVENPYQITL